jgi:hypothetical protein
MKTKKKDIKQAPIYELRIEGGFHSNYYSLKKALKVRESAEKEGWNVKLIKYESTILGMIGVEI